VFINISNIILQRLIVIFFPMEADIRGLQWEVIKVIIILTKYLFIVFKFILFGKKIDIQEFYWLDIYIFVLL
jgi:hypothetical protein